MLAEADMALQLIPALDITAVADLGIQYYKDVLTALVPEDTHGMGVNAYLLPLREVIIHLILLIQEALIIILEVTLVRIPLVAAATIATGTMEAVRAEVPVVIAVVVDHQQAIIVKELAVEEDLI